MIAIVNYGSGNVSAIANIYERLRIPYKVANDPGEVRGAGKIVLPGVGAFDDTMDKLNASGFRPILDDEVLNKKTPVLGICVGMQILAVRSEEGIAEGLGWINGEVKLINKSLLPVKPKIPHLGWNSISLKRTVKLFDGVDEQRGFYFLHSYYFECADDIDVMSTTVYGKTFASSVHHDNIYGVQFHPEKSHHNGVNVLKNFAEI